MDLCGFPVGLDSPLFLIAGPCVIESEQLALDTAGQLKELTGALGIPFIYKSSFDKANRSSHESFRGPGMEEGLRILEQVRERIGVPVLTDVHEIEQCARAAQAVDVLQIPAFLCRQTDLLIASLGPEGSSGMLMGAMIGASALVSLGAGRWIDRHGRKAALLLPASLCVVIGFAVLAASTRLSAAVLGLTAIGIGLGGINVPLIVILGELVSADRYGRAIGMYQVLGDVGGALGPIIGLEAVSRFGPTRSLTALTVALLVTVPLSIALQHREQAAYG